MIAAGIAVDRAAAYFIPGTRGLVYGWCRDKLSAGTGSRLWNTPTQPEGYDVRDSSNEDTDWIFNSNKDVGTSTSFSTNGGGSETPLLERGTDEYHKRQCIPFFFCDCKGPFIFIDGNGN